MIFMLFLILLVLGCVAWMLTVISDQLRGILTELEKQHESRKTPSERTTP